MVVIRHIVESVGRRVDVETPLSDRAPGDGSRVHVAVRPSPWMGAAEPSEVVRGPLNMDDLVRLGSCPAKPPSAS